MSKATTENAQIRAWLDEEDRYVAETIRRSGLFIQCVGGDEESPSFAYTVGLFGRGHPELLIFGLPQVFMTQLLNTFGQFVLGGGPALQAGTVVELFELSHRIMLEEVPNPGDIVFAANRHFARPDRYSVPVLQLSWDDHEGRFPSEPGFCCPELQPRPGTFRA